MAFIASQDCLNLIKESEGLHRKRSDGKIEAYLDPVKIPTIGYGSIIHMDEGRRVRLGDVITKDDAERWLKLEVNKTADAVNLLCKVDITQGIFDALVSFAFNVGTETGGLKTSTLLKKLNDKDYEGAAREFDRWIHAKGKVFAGLVTRRNREEGLFRRDGFPGESIAVGNTDVPDKDWQSPKIPLQINRTLVEGNKGEDCYILNCGLAELGYLATGSQPAKYTSVTKDAVSWFQDDRGLEVDGKFGFKTKAALTTALTNTRKRVDPKLDTVYCRLTRTGKKVSHADLEKLLLEFISPKGNILDSIDVISGAPGRQNFRVPEDPGDFAGNLEPIPQGRYTIGDIQWAGGRDNYKVDHAHPTNGIGPIFVPLIKTFRDPLPRDAFGFHLDRNLTGSPGSAGCVCPSSIDELKKLVALLRKYDPRDLFVDWGIR